MSMNSMADGVASFKLPALFNAAIRLKQPDKNAVGAAVLSKIQVDLSKSPGAGRGSSPVGVADKNPVREMSHVAESYDGKGNVITKYMDSSNEVIYQTPSESVLRTQALMSNTQVATNIKV